MSHNFINDIIAYPSKKYKISLLINLGFYITVLYRIGHFFYLIKLYPISILFWLINRILFSVDINMKAKLGGGFVIAHGIGIVIGSKVHSLGVLVVYQGVTIGGNKGQIAVHNGIEHTMPILNNNVKIYPGAKVVGPIIIGKNCEIGMNSIVTRDVPDNSIVYGINKIKNKIEER